MSNETSTEVNTNINLTHRPTHRLFHVTKDANGKNLWNQIGAAWPHKDGQGFNLRLTTMARVGQDLVLRALTAKTGGAR